MSLTLATLACLLLIAAGFVPWQVISARRFDRKVRENLTQRIHVNGIRGKSSVTRLVAAVTRSAYPTLAKTTGTDARIIFSDTNEAIIERVEANIAEQRRFLQYAIDYGRRAVVCECMAINPAYQQYLEDKLMRSTIGIITNVREDHVDQMGKTHLDIARSLARTVPRNGILITEETDPSFVEVFGSVCSERHSSCIQVSADDVTDEEMSGFQYVEFKENVACALKVAEHLGIPRSEALARMYRTIPDPGVTTIQRIDHGECVSWFVNLFAANDRESFLIAMDHAIAQIPNGTNLRKAIVLNNRADRVERVREFIDIACDDVKSDYIFTLGDHDRRAAALINQKHCMPADHVFCYGASTPHVHESGEEIIDGMIDTVGQDCVFVGAANVHTPQAERLMKRLNATWYSLDTPHIKLGAKRQQGRRVAADGLTA